MPFKIQLYKGLEAPHNDFDARFKEAAEKISKALGISVWEAMQDIKLLHDTMSKHKV